MIDENEGLPAALAEVLALHADALDGEGFEFYPHHFDDWKNRYPSFIAAACNFIAAHGPALTRLLAATPASDEAVGYREALQKIADFDGDPATPIRNSVKKSAIARAALSARIAAPAEQGVKLTEDEASALAYVEKMVATNDVGCYESAIATVAAALRKRVR